MEKWLVSRPLTTFAPPGADVIGTPRPCSSFDAFVGCYASDNSLLPQPEKIFPGPHHALPLLFDTDIGTNVDDALALAYLLRRPRCDQVGVTTVSGDVARRSARAEVICRAAGRADLPTHPRSPGALLAGPGQPDASLYNSTCALPHSIDLPAALAVEFLRQSIRAGPGRVTLLTTGPPTNIALLFAIDRRRIGNGRRKCVSDGQTGFPARLLLKKHAEAATSHKGRPGAGGCVRSTRKRRAMGITAGPSPSSARPGFARPLT